MKWIDYFLASPDFARSNQKGTVANSLSLHIKEHS